MNPTACLVGFNHVKGIGAVRLRALIDRFGSAEAAWNAPVDALRAERLPPKVLENLLAVRHSVSLETLLESYARRGIQVMTWDDPAYPRRLAVIDQPPPVLYVRGELLPEDDMAVAVVGTRKMTVYGRQVAEEIGAYLAANRITLVSGLARGVDRVAHEAVLKAGGRSIAVLGSGVDRIYPSEHSRLAEEIMRHGAVISDYAPGTPPDGVNFPPRNRIISGLSLATIVVEASFQSGSLITATFAAEQGREVFAVPGPIYGPQSKGCNQLIRDGAHPLINMEELISVLQLDGVVQKQEARSLLSDPALLTPSEARLLQVLADVPQHMDEICAQSGLPIDAVSAALTLMELKGIVRQAGAMNFSLVREQTIKYWTEENG
jgi:DNA processing protein